MGELVQPVTSQDSSIPSAGYRTVLNSADAFLTEPYFQWANEWRTAEVVTHANATPIPLIPQLDLVPKLQVEDLGDAFIMALGTLDPCAMTVIDPDVTQKGTIRVLAKLLQDEPFRAYLTLHNDFDGSVRAYTTQLSSRLGAPLMHIDIVGANAVYVQHLFGTEIPLASRIQASAMSPGIVHVTSVEFFYGLRELGGLPFGGEEFTWETKVALAHEVTHLDQYGEVTLRTVERVFRETGLMPENLGTQEEFDTFSDAFTRANEDEYKKLLGERRLTQTAKRERELLKVPQSLGPLKDARIEGEAYTVEALMENPSADRYSYSTMEGGVEVIKEGDIPEHIRNPQSYREKFLNPTLKDSPFHFAYGAARSRAAMGTLRGIELASGVLFFLDIGIAVHSINDLSQDKVDTSLDFGTATMSTSSGGLATYGLLAAKASNALPLAGLFGSLITLVVGAKSTYDDFRDFEVTNSQEKIASITEIGGGALAVTGSILLIVGSGGLAAPFILLIGGASVSTSSQFWHGQAEENRVARQVVDAINSKNWARLNELCADRRGEFDDDVAMKLFEDYFPNDGHFMSEEFWGKKELPMLRQKLIGELGGEGWASYMSDDEAAYRLFIALNESNSEAVRAAEEMDSSDWNEFYKMRLEGKLPPLVVPTEIVNIK